MNRVRSKRDKGLTAPYVLLPEEVDDIDQFLNAPDKPLIRAKTLEELTEQMGGADPRIFRATVKGKCNECLFCHLVVRNI